MTNLYEHFFGEDPEREKPLTDLERADVNLFEIKDLPVNSSFMYPYSMQDPNLSTISEYKEYIIPNNPYTLELPSAPVGVGSLPLKKAEKTPEYLYDEDRLIAEALEFIDSTYNSDSHYSGETQPTELIIDSGHGIGFSVGNIIKYAARLGKKNGWNKKDMYKVIHYAVIALHVMEKQKLE